MALGCGDHIQSCVQADGGHAVRLEVRWLSQTAQAIYSDVGAISKEARASSSSATQDESPAPNTPQSNLAANFSLERAAGKLRAFFSEHPKSAFSLRSKRRPCSSRRGQARKPRSAPMLWPGLSRAENVPSGSRLCSSLSCGLE